MMYRFWSKIFSISWLHGVMVAQFMTHALLCREVDAMTRMDSSEAIHEHVAASDEKTPRCISSSFLLCPPCLLSMLVALRCCCHRQDLLRLSGHLSDRAGSRQ